MDTPHVLDTAGREAYRKELIAEAKRMGFDIADDATIDEARKALSGPLPSKLLYTTDPAPTVVKRKNIIGKR